MQTGKTNVQEYFIKNINNKSTEQLLILGIKVVYEFDNGMRVVELPESISNDKVVDTFNINKNTLYKIINIPDTTPNKECIQEARFKALSEMHYGLVELIHENSDVTYSKDMYSVIETNESKYKTEPGEYRGIILNKQGKIVVDTLNILDEILIKQIHEPIIEEIIEYGVHEDLYSVRGSITKSFCDFYINNSKSFINTKNICSGKYQLAVISYGLCASYVIFDIEKSDVLAYGIGVPYYTEEEVEYEFGNAFDYMPEVTFTLANDCLIAFNNIEGTYTKQSTEVWDVNKHGGDEAKRSEWNNNLVINMMDYMTGLLVEANKHMKLEKRYNGYSEREVRWFSGAPTFDLKQVGIDVIQVGKARVLKAVSDVCMRYDEIKLDLNGKRVNKEQEKYVFIVDGIDENHPYKEYIELLDYEQCINHPNSIVELRNFDSSVNYEEDYTVILLDIDGNILFENASDNIDDIRIFDRNTGNMHEKIKSIIDGYKGKER